MTKDTTFKNPTALADTTEYQIHFAAQLGFITKILFQSPRVAFRIASISSQIWPAIQLGQSAIFFTQQGVPFGYAIWAFLSDEVSAEVAQDDKRLLHLSEWNEGTNLWIMDFLTTRGDVFRLASKLRRSHLMQHDRFRGIRRNADGTIKKIVDIRFGDRPGSTGETDKPQ